MLRSLLLCSCVAVGLAPAIGCKSSEPSAATAEQSPSTSSDAFIEQHERGSVSWVVSGDGKAHAVVLGLDGKPVTTKLNGSLTWNGRAVPMAQDDKTSALDAQGPTLEADITQIGYVITTDDGAKSFRGTLHLPRGGTKELAESSRAAIKVKVAKKGPHGGKVQVVGDDRLEIVANPQGGEVRVYVLDADLKPVPVENRKITLAVVTDNKPEVIVLTPDAKGEYATGKLTAAVDPVKVTVSVTRAEETRVVLVDYEPGVFVVVSEGGPHVHIVVKGTFWTAPAAVVVDDDDDDDDHHHHHHHHRNIHIKNGKHHVHINEH